MLGTQVGVQDKYEKSGLSPVFTVQESNFFSMFPSVTLRGGFNHNKIVFKVD